ncbi:MAG: hypothetical protein L3J31_04285 [Bacteroidales bacterium]|nr:hypothetical protein [Bacteroidales bacterium]
MKSSNNDWKLQKQAFNDKLNEALKQQHHATQFLALAGRHLIPQKDDDSNTNVEFIPGENLLLGNELPNGMRVGLHLTELKLLILDAANNTKKTIRLEGKTQKEVFVELTQNLADVGINVTNFKNELHYEIPAHPLDEGAVFSIEDKNDFLENANYRNNAKIVLNEIAGEFASEEPIRIWPHHFDTGAFYVISKNEKGEMAQTIGVGFAIPDSMIDEPYYYLSFWSEKPVEGIDKLSALDGGNWMMPDWNGAILKHSELLKTEPADEQCELVKSFYQSRIKSLLDCFKK